jgi:methyl-accepting chemotaxis protein
VDQILATVANLARRIDEQASAVAQSSAAIEEMAAAIDSVARIADRRQAAADELQRITRDGGEKVSAANQNISEISANVDDMLQMIDLINDIASRTNLLSMNAAIEAAHAGDAGRGFSVVADEIRKLAESTSENAKQVSGNLKAIVDKISSALTASMESGRAFETISSEVSEVVSAFAEITSSTAELARGSQEILSSSQSLLQITEQIRGSAGEMKVGARAISDDLVGVNEISSHALERIGRINEGAGSIERAMEQIAHLSEENRENAAEVAEKVRQFRIAGDSGADKNGS